MGDEHIAGTPGGETVEVRLIHRLLEEPVNTRGPPRPIDGPCSPEERDRTIFDDEATATRHVDERATERYGIGRGEAEPVASNRDVVDERWVVLVVSIDEEDRERARRGGLEEVVGPAGPIAEVADHQQSFRAEPVCGRDHDALKPDRVRVGVTDEKDFHLSYRPAGGSCARDGRETAVKTGVCGASLLDVPSFAWTVPAVKRHLLLLIPVLAVASACSSGNTTPDTTVTSVPMTATTDTGAAPEDAAGVLKALQAPLSGPLSVELTDGEITMVLTEDAAGNRSFLQKNELAGDTEIKVVDGRVYMQAEAGSAFAGRWAAFSLEDFAAMGEELAPDAPLRDLLEDAYLSVFGYSIDECLDQQPVPVRNGGNSWSVPCTPDVVYEVTFDAQGRVTANTTSGGYSAIYTRDVPVIVAPTDVLSEADMSTYYDEVLLVATRTSVETTLETLRRSAEAQFAADTRLTDSVIIDEILSEATGMTASVVRDGMNAVRVTSGGSVTCSGKLTVTKGKSSISKVDCEN